MKTYLLCSVGYEERTMKDSNFKTNDASVFARLHSEPFTPKIFGVDLCLFPYNPLKILAYISQTFAVTFEWNTPWYIRRVGCLTYANRIQIGRASIHPRIKAIAKEKSHFSRKSTHFQFRHDFGTRTMYINLSPR